MYNKNYMSIQCGQQSSQPATTASGFDRDEARNPLQTLAVMMSCHKK